MHGRTKRFLKDLAANGLLVALLILASVHPIQAETNTIRFMAWNILNYTQGNALNHNEAGREPYYQTVIRDINPDIISIEEVWSGMGSNRFLNNVLNQVDPGKWAKSLLTPTSSYDVQLYYRTDRGITLGPVTWVAAPVRDLVQAQVNIQTGDSVNTMFVFLAHLKAGDTDPDESTRAEQIDSLVSKIHARSLVGKNLLFCGDFNLYGASGAAWQTLAASNLFRDPIDRVGEWHNNQSYEDVHTQSARSSSFSSDGGSGGGMDDRFDFILVSPEFFDSTGLDYVPGSYLAYGNDGNHFNQSINYIQNGAVRPGVADALYYASDHIPVVMEISTGEISGVAENRPQTLPSRFTIVSVYPNPFNGTANIQLNLRRPVQVRLALYDLLGRQVWESRSGVLSAGIHRVALRADNLPSGVYLLRSVSGGTVETRRLTLIR